MAQLVAAHELIFQGPARGDKIDAPEVQEAGALARKKSVEKK